MYGMPPGVQCRRHKEAEGAEHRVAQAGPGRPPEKVPWKERPAGSAGAGQEALRGCGVSGGGYVMCKGPEVRARRPAGLSGAGASAGVRGAEVMASCVALVRSVLSAMETRGASEQQRDPI